MSPSGRLHKLGTVLTGCMALAAGLAVLGSGDSSPLGIGGYTVTGDTVQVIVENAGDETLTGKVHVRVVGTDGRETTAWTRITVHGAQKAYLDMRFPSEVIGVITLGVILDDGCPFF